jgi:hypothetical protein
MSHLCAICVRREATTRELIDGKFRPVCAPCVDDEVPEPENTDTPRHRLLRVIRRTPDLLFVQLREHLNIPEGGKYAVGGRSEDSRLANLYAKTLERLVKAGDVVRDGKWPEYTYRIAAEQRRAA